MKKSKVVVPEVVEDTAVATTSDTQPSTLNLQRDGIVKTIAKQIEVVHAYELKDMFEKLRLGAMVKQAVTMLGLEGRGRGNVGLGVKGWWEENFRDAEGKYGIGYTRLMNWIKAAENIPEIMRRLGASGAGGLTVEKTLSLLAKDPEQVVGKDAKILKSTEKVAKGMTLSQMLLFGGEETKGRQGGANKGQAGTGRRALTPVEKAEDADVEIRQLIGKIIAFDKGEKFRMLTAQTQSDIILALKDVVKSFEEQQA